MKNIYIVFLVSLSFLTGCAIKPQLPVELGDSFWSVKEKKVGVVMTKMPELDVHLPGADCLLCIGVAELANSSLSTHVSTLSADDLIEIKQKLATRLKKRGLGFSVIDESVDIKSLPEYDSKTPNSTRNDFSTYMDKYNISHLLVVQTNMIGMQRRYSGYIPTSDPKAVYIGASYLVNLSNNTYDWYYPVSVYRSANNNWDESPSFPGLTNAYYQTLEEAKEAILSTFDEDLQKDTVAATSKVQH